MEDIDEFDLMMELFQKIGIYDSKAKNSNN